MDHRGAYPWASNTVYFTLYENNYKPYGSSTYSLFAVVLAHSSVDPYHIIGLFFLWIEGAQPGQPRNKKANGPSRRQWLDSSKVVRRRAQGETVKTELF